MSTHYNAQIHVQRVEKRTGPVSGNQLQRDITEVLDVKMTADSEAEAYAKVQRLLAAHAGGE